MDYENLRKIAELGTRFLSRLRETFRAAEELKQAAWAEDACEEIGPLSPRKGAAQYRVQERTCELEGRKYRTLVVYSTRLDQCKEQTFERRVVKEREAIQKAAATLQQHRFLHR